MGKAKQRNYIREYDTGDFQEGSRVKVRELTWGDAKSMRKQEAARRRRRTLLEAKQQTALDAENFEEWAAIGEQIEALEDEQTAETEKLLARNLIEWDWVGADGEPLPLPKDDAAVVDLLTPSEVTFLVKKIGGDPDEAKNGGGSSSSTSS